MGGKERKREKRGVRKIKGDKVERNVENRSRGGRGVKKAGKRVWRREILGEKGRK